MYVSKNSDEQKNFVKNAAYIKGMCWLFLNVAQDTFLSPQL